MQKSCFSWLKTFSKTILNGFSYLIALGLSTMLGVPKFWRDKWQNFSPRWTPGQTTLCPPIPERHPSAAQCFREKHFPLTRAPTNLWSKCPICWFSPLACRWKTWPFMPGCGILSFGRGNTVLCVYLAVIVSRFLTAGSGTVFWNRRFLWNHFLYLWIWKCLA